MKKLFQGAAALLLLATLNSQFSTTSAQGTAFTYQGQLQNNGSPASGTFNLTFTLYAVNISGSAIAGPVTNNGVLVTDGLFTATIDFGSSVWNGATRWLQIAVETNGGSSFTALTPRQDVTPTPYAIYAEGSSAAGLSGTIPMASLSGVYSDAVSFNNTVNSFSGNGAGLVDVNALTLDGLGAANFWQLTGNAGTTAGLDFVGTTDNQPLELHVNDTRALRLEPTVNDANHASIVNVVGGSAVNFDASGVRGGTIAGGGAENYFGSTGTNSVTADFGTVGGGLANKASGLASVVGGGGYEGTIVDGNTASGTASVVGGGIGNLASFFTATVGGGYGNSAGGSSFGATTVAGGLNNNAQSDFATISGGDDNIAGGVGSFVGGGGTDGSTSPPFGLINDWPNNASGGASVIGGGLGNTNSGYTATIAGGAFNSASGIAATVAGGEYNYAIGTNSTVGGGVENQAFAAGSVIAGGGTDGNAVYGNYAYGIASVIGGGLENTTRGNVSMIPGGFGNTATGYASFAAGAYSGAVNDDTFVWSDNNIFNSTAANQFLIHAAGGVGIGTNAPQAQLHVSSNGGNSFPQAQLDQQNASDYSRLRFTVSGNLNNRWDVGTTATNFIIYSGKIGANMIYLDKSGLTVNGAFVSSSDRNVKAGFEPVDTKAVLARVAAMPITRWHYTNDVATPHLGPMAQDFYAAFSVGMDDKHIATVDEEGVALAAIQGLNQKLEGKDAEIQTLKQQNDLLAERLNELEATVKQLAARK
jgi:hypothetical protein